MSVKLSPFGPKPQFVLTTGLPAVGYQLFFYVAASSTKQNTYTDSTGGSANTNPIVLNALGEPTTQIWFTTGQTYKAVLAPANDTDPPNSPVWTVDNISGINDTSTSVDEWTTSALTPTYVSGTSFTLAGDQTSTYLVGRRLKFTVTAGTVYGTIATSVFGALTTVTMTMDTAQVLDSGLSAVSLGILRPTNVSIPNFITAGSGVSITYVSGKPTITVTGQATVNGLINGGHEVWQRGSPISVAASSNGYGADRWALTTGANQACTMTQAAGLVSGSQSSGQIQRTAGQTGTGVLVYEQPFELSEIIKWRGQTITVSASISTGANWSPTNGTLTMAIACGTGAAARRGNTPYTGETQPLSSANNITAGTAVSTYSATASAIIPTTTTQMTLMFYWTPVGTAGAADLFTVDDVMYSASVGAAYERRIVEAELAMCQRYYWKTFPQGTTPAQNSGTAAGALTYLVPNAGAIAGGVNLRYPVTMRITPATITGYNPNAANANWRNTTAGADSGAINIGNSGDSGAIIYNGQVGGDALNQIISIHITASAEL